MGAKCLHRETAGQWQNRLQKYLLDIHLISLAWCHYDKFDKGCQVHSGGEEGANFGQERGAPFFIRGDILNCQVKLI